MPLGNASSGHNNATDYQTPGLPWVRTISIPTTPTLVAFPKVTRGISIRNLDSANDLHVGFTENGLLGDWYVTIPAGELQQFEIRTKQLYMQFSGSSASTSIAAELTLVDQRQFPILTGSAVVESNPGSGWIGVG